MMNFFKKNKADYSYLPKRFWLDKDLTKTELEAQRKRHLWQKVLPGVDFIEILDNNFTPFVKEYDFRGRKNNFYKHEPPFIYAIGIQKDKYGGKCSLNIGIHLDYCPQPIDNKLFQVSKHQVPHCMIQYSITLPNGNSRYDYGDNHQQGLETAGYMIKMLKEKGLPFIDMFKNYPVPFDRIKIKDIKNPNEKYSDWNIDKRTLSWPHFHLYLSRIAYSLNDVAKGKEIAEIGLRLLISRKPKSPLIPRFEKLVNEDLTYG